MRAIRNVRKRAAGILAMVLILVLAAGIPELPARAASGSVYTCTITPCYAHPVTGEIEDSGGESSYATGQGMVEGCVYTTGLMEVTSGGAYYLTIKMSLMDYTSEHSFWTQEVGGSGWTAVSELGVTGTGTDNNGTTNDVCLRVPSENCIVRISMYVEPMGREVIFYLYPSDYTSGNSTDMNATMVTSTESSSSSSSSSSDSTSSDSDSSSSSSSGSSSLTSSSLSEEDSEEDAEEESGEEEESAELESTIDSAIEEASTDESDDDSDSELDEAEGLSLSTAEESSEDETELSTSGYTVGQQIAIRLVPPLVVGLALIAAGAFVVYLFRKNWNRWGGAQDDLDDEDEEGEDGEEENDDEA